MESTRTFTDKVFLVMKGLGMGAANKVPGVSGGTVSFVKYKWTLLIIGVIVTEILLRYYTDYSLIPIFKAIIIFIIDTIRSILN